MLPAELLQQRPWQFDPTSALIGALVAFALSALAYRYRGALKALGRRLWSPIATLRQRARSSEEEKYLEVLQSLLRRALLFEPNNPALIFQPPTFRAPPPLPTHLSDPTRLPAPLVVTYEAVTQGHPRVVMVGPLASGRTTALAMQVWRVAANLKDHAIEYLPVWIDLQQVRDLPEDKQASPLERFVQLAVLFMPDVLPKWLLSHLRRIPALILVDNWDALTEDERQLVALWFAEIAQQLPESRWLIAAGEQGYGALVQAGFVAATIVPDTSREAVARLYNGWSALLNGPESQDTPVEDVIDALYSSAQAGATLLELTLRCVVYLNTGQMPVRPVEVMDYLLETRIPPLDLGEGQETLADHARMLTLNTLTHIAKAHRLERHAFTRQEISDTISSLLPVEEDLDKSKLESATRKLVTECGLLHREGKTWRLNHYVWDEFLTALYLGEDETATELLLAHLDTPSWGLLIEFYVGLAEATPLVHAMLRKAAQAPEDPAPLLRLGRWGVIAPEEAEWRRLLLKALAQAYMLPSWSHDQRLSIGMALALNAGEGARAFFLQALRNPSTEVRAAALRGLGWTGTPREMPVLAGALGDQALTIRQSAVRALQDMATPGAIRLLGDALYKSDEQLTLIIAQALNSQAAGQEILKEAARDSDLLIRRAAAYGLASVTETWAEELLAEMMREDPEWLVRSAAESALSTRKEVDTGLSLILPPPQPDSIDWLIAWAARQGSGLGIGEAAVDMLLRAAQEGEPESQALSLLTLMQIGRREHLPVLLELTDAEDPSIAWLAQQTYRHIEQRFAAPA